MKLLTIAIPTFNRSTYLEKLLANLEAQEKADSLGDRINIIILDNHSTDNTSDLAAEYANRHASWKHVRHAKNIGPDLNFLSAIENVNTEYLWIIGDDDLPRQALLRRIVELLVRERPDTVYLTASWHNNIYNQDQRDKGELVYGTLDAFEFASRTHVYTTFISSWIIRIPTLTRLGITTEKIKESLNTNLIQLEWILPFFREGTKKISVDSESVLATGSNSGGYQALLVFGASYPKLVYKIISDSAPVRHALIDQMLINFYSSLILHARLGYLGDFKFERQAIPEITMRLWTYKHYWTLCFAGLVLPTKLLPRPPWERATLKAVANRLSFLCKQAAKLSLKILFDRPFDKLSAKIQQRQDNIKRRVAAAILEELGKCGTNVRLPLDCEIGGARFIEIGDNFMANRGLRMTCYPNSISHFHDDPSLKIGNDVFFNREVFISCSTRVEVGSGCVFGSNVFISDNYHGSTKRVSLDRMAEKLTSPGEIKIGKGAWIGNNVCILPNADIGEGTIVGANSVVNSKLPPYVIAAGCPARVLRSIESDSDGKS